MIAPKVFTVGQINRYIKNLLENDFILNSLLVQGEISNFKAHSSGHWYFTLKDATGALSCMIFRQDAEEIPFLPENGMQVILYGRVSLYERTGQYQLYGEFMEPVGMGALQMAFEQMKEKLAAEGLFDADFKREMPAHAKCIAVVTSPVGAAVRDVIQIVKRRDPRVKIAVFPTLVQGEKAAEDIVRSLRLANEWGGADVIILGRGGGSMEDLWPFNEEKVARAVFASEIPVISAVGHETDFTITDFVSDLRAPTPSAAAELATAIPLESRIAMLEGMQGCFSSHGIQQAAAGIFERASRFETPSGKITSAAGGRGRAEPGYAAGNHAAAGEKRRASGGSTGKAGKRFAFLCDETGICHDFERSRTAPYSGGRCARRAETANRNAGRQAVCGGNRKGGN